MPSNLDSLIQYAIASGERDTLRALEQKGRHVKPKNWAPEEDRFLREQLGFMTDMEIGRRLGRTGIAVHLHWKRDLRIIAPSKNPDVITACQAAGLLGIDTHKIAHWVDKGFIPGRIMAGGRRIRLINRESFRAWVLKPAHWIYFDIRRVKDAELKKLLKNKAKAWGDEWWDTPRVAKYHGVNTRDVKRYIQLGRIHATQIQYSLGGRHPNMSWKLWFILKSEATRRDLVFVRRKK